MAAQMELFDRKPVIALVPEVDPYLFSRDGDGQGRTS